MSFLGQTGSVIASQRTYVIGITGPMAAGKSHFSQIFKDFAYPVFDADQEVKKIQTENAAIQDQIRHDFPNVFGENGQIDRQKLREAVLDCRDSLAKMEKIIFPAVKKACSDFIQLKNAEHARLVVLDIPLLWGSGISLFCDKIFYVDCPEMIRNERILKRGVFTKSEKQLIDERQAEERNNLTDQIVIIRGDAPMEKNKAFIADDLKKILAA